MILQKEIRELAVMHGVPKSTIDKDWVLSHVLNGLFSHELLSKQLIFKGGTCLRKCYFENYRFSEDLDFSVVNSSTEISEVLIKEAITNVEYSSGIKFYLEEFTPMLFEDKKVGCKCNIKYWGADHPKNQVIPPPDRWHTYIKIEIICNELLCYKPAAKPLCHKYSDEHSINKIIPCYSLEEVICEKLRAMLQRKYTAPRDYYDTWYILHFIAHPIDWNLLSQNFKLKALFKNISCTRVDDFFTDKNMRILKAHWFASLGHHMKSSDLPDVNTVVIDLKETLLTKLIL